jgi:uncharacterized sulfatase
MDLSVYGHPSVQTPNLDRLAARGTVFDNAYCPAALCNPSRVSLMTGQRPPTTGVLNNATFTGNTLNGVPTLPFHFRNQGYAVAGAGKVFHQNYVEPSTWDVYLAMDPDFCNDPWIAQPTNPVPQDSWRPLYWGPFQNGPDGSLGTMCDTKSTDAALGLMGTLQEPFFLAVGLVATHNPFTYPEALDTLYDPLIDVPPLPPEESGSWRDSVPPMAYFTEHYMDPAYQNDPEGGRRELTAAYWRCVTYLDSEVGRLLDELELLGLEQNTIVVFVSDHGFSLGQHGYFGKWTLYDESARSPLIVAAPGRAGHGTHCLQPAEQIDLYPMLMELCSLSIPQGLEGQSLVPLLDDPQAPFKPAAFSYRLVASTGESAYLSRTQDAKFVYWEQTRMHQFYDLTDDPGEYINRHGVAGYRAQGMATWRHLIDAGLLTCDASWQNYGSGLAGTQSMPTLALSDLPLVGTAIQMEVSNSLGSSTLGIRIYGLNSASIPAFGGTLLVEPQFLVSHMIPATGFNLQLPIPNNLNFCGVPIYTQFLQIDSGAVAGVSLTPGLEMIVGVN